MTAELTPEEAKALRQQLAAHDAAQLEAAKAVSRALLAPMTGIGLGGTGPLTCSLEGLAACVRTHAASMSEVDPSFPAYAVQVATVLDGFDRRIRTLVAQNAATQEAPPVTPPEEPQGE